MSLQECKDQIARRHGNKDWEDFINFCREDVDFPIMLCDYSDEAHNLYITQILKGVKIEALEVCTPTDTNYPDGCTPVTNHTGEVTIIITGKFKIKK